MKSGALFALLASLECASAGTSKTLLSAKDGHRGPVLAPYSGVPFLLNVPLEVLPSRVVDEHHEDLSIYRLMPNPINKDGPHTCDDGDQAGKGKCLGHAGRGCMWTRVEGRDPTIIVQSSNSYCLPCELDGNKIPCWNVGAFVGGMQVTDCEMSCKHHERIYQPQYACSDESGFISGSQCFNIAALSQSKCMFITYKDDKGTDKSSCGPCALDGAGGWGCPAVGGPGPSAGSKVTSCVSQCDTICPGPPACPPTVAPPPPPPPPSPGLPRTALNDDKEMISAPAPWPVPTVNPFTIMEAARKAAEAAGWVVAEPAPPKSYMPVIIYRSPGDYAFSTGPPPSLLQLAQQNKQSVTAFLAKFRHTGRFGELR